MKNFFLLALAGVIAQLVDGSLGMAYGVSSTTVLLAAGVAPALASASVHMLAVPGGIGALLGALVLVWAVSLEATAAYVEPAVAVFLFMLGIYVLSRFAFRRTERPVVVRHVPRAFLSPLGFVAGFLDAFGGGGWGPIATPTLLSSGRMEPRKIIGTVDTSEFVIAVCASIGFLISLSLAEVPWTIVAALFLGGLIAAPIAAYIVRILPTRIMGTAVGGFILVVNANTFFGAVGLSSSLSTVAFIIIIAVWIAALAFAIGARRQDQEEAVEGQAV
jgi:uncharacterized membrane protein YfcA